MRPRWPPGAWRAIIGAQAYTERTGGEMGAFQPWHWILVAVIALIVFGPSKLPELGASLGKSIREFKKTTSEITEIKDSVKGSVDSVKTTVTTAVTLDPTKPAVPAAPSAQVATVPLPTQPEGPPPAPVALRREVID